MKKPYILKMLCILLIPYGTTNALETNLKNLEQVHSCLKTGWADQTIKNLNFGGRIDQAAFLVKLNKMKLNLPEDGNGNFIVSSRSEAYKKLDQAKKAIVDQFEFYQYAMNRSQLPNNARAGFGNHAGARDLEAWKNFDTNNSVIQANNKLYSVINSENENGDRGLFIRPLDDKGAKAIFYNLSKTSPDSSGNIYFKLNNISPHSFAFNSALKITRTKAGEYKFGGTVYNTVNTKISKLPTKEYGLEDLSKIQGYLTEIENASTEIWSTPSSIKSVSLSFISSVTKCKKIANQVNMPKLETALANKQKELKRATGQRYNLQESRRVPSSYKGKGSSGDTNGSISTKNAN
jgi:hypothetical protein